MFPTRLPHLNVNHLAIAFSVALVIALLWAFAPALIHDKKRGAFAQRMAVAALVAELVATAMTGAFTNWFSDPVLSSDPSASQYRIATNWESTLVNARPEQKRAAIAQAVRGQTGATLLSTPDPWDEGDLLDQLVFPDSSIGKSIGIDVMDDHRAVVPCQLTLGAVTWRGQPVTIDCGKHKTKSHTPAVTLLTGRDDKELDQELRRYGWAMDSPSDTSFGRFREFSTIDPAGTTRACRVAPAWRSRQPELYFIRGREQFVFECSLVRGGDLMYEVPELIEKRA